MPRTAITNARVFDGTALKGPETVVIDSDGKISADTEAAADDTTIDGTGCTLLPGLIDCHVHVSTPEDLDTYLAHGVTTVLDMGTADSTEPFRTRAHTAQYRGAGLPAFAPGSRHEALLGRPGLEACDGPTTATMAAEAFVDERVAEGADYVKIIADEPGFPQEALDALVSAARARGKPSIAHAAHHAAYLRALQAGVDVLTHVPLDQPVDGELAARIAQTTPGVVVVPTLVMMEKFAAMGVSTAHKFDNALASLAALHAAGVPILSGTDANTQPGLALPVGASLARELGLYIRAGLSTLEALRAATALPARHLGLGDRGAIAPGLRADLVLVEGNPVQDIEAVTRVKKVWLAGVEAQVAGGA